MFMINPGHRIVFRVSIWKNDVTSFNNTQKVAMALGVQPDWFGPPRQRPPINLDLETIIRILLQKSSMDAFQNKEIAWLKRALRRIIRNLPDNRVPDDQIDPDDPFEPPTESCCENYPDCECDSEEDPVIPEDPDDEGPEGTSEQVNELLDQLFEETDEESEEE